MDYKEAVEYINDKNKFGSRPGLKSIGALLDLLGNPEEGLKYVHIGGTNGKGSTSSFISNILMAGGYDVGIFTSPYIERFNERIQKNKEDIPDDTLARLTTLVASKCEEMTKLGYDHPTTFEIITALGFLYFKEEEVDYVVLEVGLGGRYDSTNIINNSLASVITQVSIDHTGVLGNSLEEITYQKAGIIKEGSLVFSYFQDEEVRNVLNEEAKKQGAKISYLDKDRVEIKRLDPRGGSFNYQDYGNRLEDLEIGLIGGYQIYNACLAVKTILGLRREGKLRIDDRQIRQGLKITKWAGRIELLMDKPRFLIDGAHNVAGAKSLEEALNLFTYDKLILGLGILADKEYEDVVKILTHRADIVVVTEVDMPRKLEATKLKEVVDMYSSRVYLEKDIGRAIKKSLDLASENDLVVFAGSLYLVGRVRTIIKQLY